VRHLPCRALVARLFFVIDSIPKQNFTNHTSATKFLITRKHLFTFEEIAMKKTTCLLTTGVLAVAASVPSIGSMLLQDSLTHDSMTGFRDRFDTASYKADTSNTENLEGLWIMTSRNYQDVSATRDGSNGDLHSRRTSGSFRMACTIVQINEQYHSSCDGAGALNLSGNALSNAEGSWTASITDNTHISGSYSTRSITLEGLDGTTENTTSLDFEMVKINAPGSVIGMLAVTGPDEKNSSGINEFYETNMVEKITHNGKVQSSKKISVLNAFSFTDDAFVLYSNRDKTGLLANTSNLNIRANSITTNIRINSADTVSMLISGIDTNNQSFKGKLDINL
jgi:hypothetical protein